MKTNSMNMKLSLKILKIIIALPIIVYLFLIGINKNNKETLSYEEKSNLDYIVCLKEQGIYEELCQKKGMNYVASAIDYIDINFDYSFRMDKKVDYTYTYYIEGLIIINDKAVYDKPLLEKVVKLSEEKEFKTNDVNLYAIRENLKINYSEYNDIIKTYKETYSVAVESSLKIDLHINTKAKYENFKEPIKTHNTLELVIPLTESTIDIKMFNNDADNKDTITQDSEKLNINYFFVITAILLTLYVINLIKFVVQTLLRTYNNQSEYTKFIKKIQKNYDRMIVTIANNAKIKEEDYEEIFDVTTFEELVDIAQGLSKNIVWTEVKYKTGLSVSWYTITDGKRLYRKIYQSVDSKDLLK